MDQIEVIAVTGTNPVERMRHAQRLAAMQERTLIPAQRLSLLPDPVDEAVALASGCGQSGGAVIEFPGVVPVTELIGALVGRDAPTRLRGVVCVVDAVHLLDDLRRDSYAQRLILHADRVPDTQHIAHAMLAVTQIEFASTIVLVEWDRLSTPDLATVMALVAHLSPRARLRLQSVGIEQGEQRAAYGVGQERPGWVGLLNGEYDPHMTDRRVSAFRYQHERPLHPERLQRLLDDRIEQGEFGQLVRSAGFCRLATRIGTVARWDQVGPMISFEPLQDDDDLLAGEELLAIGQDIAFIGLDLDRYALAAALDEVALTDAEFAAGADLWADMADPFPAWATAGDLLD